LLLFCCCCCVLSGANKRFKQLLLQQTGTWDEEGAALLANFKGEGWGSNGIYATLVMSACIAMYALCILLVFYPTLL
jgi:hypothetical protein